MARAKLYTCPQCNASDTTPIDDASGDRKCNYCGARYHYQVPAEALLDATAEPPKLGPVKDKGGKVALVLLMALLVIAAVFTQITKHSHKANKKNSQASVVSVTPPKLAAKTPEPVLSAQFSHHSSHKDSIGNLWLYGMVTNTSSVAVAGPEVIAVLKNQQGAEVATEHAYASYALQAGESGPLALSIRSPPVFATIEFETHSRKNSTELAQGLSLLAPQLRVDAGGRVTMSGKVVNKGSKAARFVQVNALVYDNENKLIDLRNGFVKGDSLKPGSETRFFLTRYARPDTNEHVEYKIIGQVDKR